MRINARFSSICPACHRSIEVGTQVEWTKGSQARHVACPTPTTTSTEPKPAATSTESAPIRIIRRCGWQKPAIDSEVGITFRIGPKGGEHAGQVVTVVKQSRSYMSRDDAEDMAGPDDAGWTLTLNCRLATDAEAAPVLAREAEAATALEAKRVALEAAKKAEADAKVEREALVAGLTRTCHAAPVADLVRLHEWKSGMYNCTFSRGTLNGQTVYVETANGHDDWRTYLYAPLDIVTPIWDAWAQQCNITPAKAAEWLSKYSGCEGAEGYTYIASKG